MTIWLHPPRSGARPVDSRPKRGRDYHPIHAHTNAPKQSHIRHQELQHFMNALNVTGGRAVPEPRPATPGTICPMVRMRMSRRQNGATMHAPHGLNHKGKKANPTQ
ncbi:hypothetical protein TcCL_ESM10945 [Trypanosoma cruzi]|nr:hypothetical protein TcCL_Unassigned02008 [Trypanosoma cruzi]RNC51893.1 hypothetical protein TcCL_ESM10945 [Trypanosoma cruzi]